MLLRSASTPLLNSWLHHSRDSSAEPEIVHQIPRSRSILHLLSGSPSSSLSPIIDDSPRKISRARSETDLRDLSITRTKPFTRTLSGFSEVAEEGDVIGFTCSNTLSFSCGLISEVSDVGVLVGGGVGGTGGGICGGGGSDGGDDGSSGFGDHSSYGNESTDLYYQKMIEANPGNSMLLSNYARFLKEVHLQTQSPIAICWKKKETSIQIPNVTYFWYLYDDLFG